MNSSELRKLLAKVSSLPLEKLSSSEIKRYAHQTYSLIESLEKLDIVAKVELLNNSIPLEDRPFYLDFLKRSPFKRPSTNAKKAIWEKYYNALKKYYEKIHQQKKVYVKLLDKLQKSSLKTGLKAIKSMKPNEKRLLSILASLSVKSSRGVKPLVLSSSEANNTKWLTELKNIKELGVLANEDISSFF
ncbi:MAG: hypothetical protein KDK36_05240 [Leptospiraceae bacterium]|nr:hypothetical protein [Leptospiraceae bacterium]